MQFTPPPPGTARITAAVPSHLGRGAFSRAARSERSSSATPRHMTWLMQTTRSEWMGRRACPSSPLADADIRGGRPGWRGRRRSQPLRNNRGQWFLNTRSCGLGSSDPRSLSVLTEPEGASSRVYLLLIFKCRCYCEE